MSRRIRLCDARGEPLRQAVKSFVTALVIETGRCGPTSGEHGFVFLANGQPRGSRIPSMIRVQLSPPCPSSVARR